MQDLLVEAKNVTVTDEELNKEIQYYIDELGYKDKKDVLDTMPEEENPFRITVYQSDDSIIKRYKDSESRIKLEIVQNRAGLAAALKAREKAEKVAVLERNDELGGI